MPETTNHRLAILSFQSHGDRSFLDDRELAFLSGHLRQEGFDNDLVLTVLAETADEGEEGRAIEARLAETLEPYGLVAYERIWDPRVIERLREAWPDKTFVYLSGEHLLENPPADYLVRYKLRHMVPGMLNHLISGGPPPPGAERRTGSGWELIPDPAEPPHNEYPFAPNLRPVVVNPEHLAEFRTFAVKGNDGCPYQYDARENPVYDGVEIPETFGRGCAFCRTGNSFEGGKTTEIGDRVMEQVRYVVNESDYRFLVVKDQHPFGYLPQVLQACRDEGLTDFTLMLETRADWMISAERRMDVILDAARDAGVRICPYLVGIENFSQPELDRYNKGIEAAVNIEFIETLFEWRERWPGVLDLDHASFGFVLFNPWTTLADLRTNLEAIERTNFDQLRGHVLHSRARLYEDTALYYLAKHDGLLIEDFQGKHEDNSRRYGYYPAQPWRFEHEVVKHFADVAAEVVERTRGRDEIRHYRYLVERFEAAGDDWASITAEEVLAAVSGGGEGKNVGRPTGPEPEAEAVRQRFARLVRPLRLDQAFATGWSFAGFEVSPGQLRVSLTHPTEGDFDVELVPRSEGPSYARSRHYDIRYRLEEMTALQRQALETLSRAIVSNDA